MFEPTGCGAFGGYKYNEEWGHGWRLESRVQATLLMVILWHWPNNTKSFKGRLTFWGRNETNTGGLLLLCLQLWTSGATSLLNADGWQNNQPIRVTWTNDRTELSYVQLSSWDLDENISIWWWHSCSSLQSPLDRDFLHTLCVVVLICFVGGDPK